MDFNISNQFQIIRKSQNIKLSELAQLTGKPPSYYKKIETGERLVCFGELVNIALLLKVDYRTLCY